MEEIKKKAEEVKGEKRDTMESRIKCMDTLHNTDTLVSQSLYPEMQYNIIKEPTVSNPREIVSQSLAVRPEVGEKTKCTIIQYKLTGSKSREIEHDLQQSDWKYLKFSSATTYLNTGLGNVGILLSSRVALPLARSTDSFFTSPMAC